MKITTAQIGKCGELFCQFLLLKLGIESAPMTTDSGIDLVAYSEGKKKAFTIQVKTCHQPKPAGGRGRESIDWWIPKDSPADYVAVVNIQTLAHPTPRVWLFTISEIKEVAQCQLAPKLHFFMKTDPSAPPRKDGKLQLEKDFEMYLLEKAVKRNGL